MELYTEKYRPIKREEIVGNKDIVDKVFNMAENGTITHFIFSGPAGCGKTTLALALGRNLLKENFGSNFLELNASDDRKLEDVQNTVKVFARTSPLESEFKIILLDEADSMDVLYAQPALRRIMEKYSKVTRFILSCNRLEKIIDPIQSRCQVFRFSPLTPEDILPRLKFISEKEGLKATEEGLKCIAEDSGGDMRKALNWLQVLANSGMPVTPEAYSKKKKTDMPERIWDNLKIERLLMARKDLVEYMALGYDEREIIQILHESLICRKDIKYITRGELIIQLAETDYRLMLGTSKGLQLDALLLKMFKIFKENKDKPDEEVN